jgi:integrase
VRKPPKLQFHKSTGQFYVRVRKGRSGSNDDFTEYFGDDETSAELAYKAWVVEWVQAGVAGKVRQVGSMTPWHTHAGLSPDVTDELTLRELGDRYISHCDKTHTRNEAKNKRLVVEHVLRHVGDVYWSEFGTAAYMDLQDALVAEGRTRQRINKICSYVRGWMKWCYLRQLISNKLHQDFRDVGPVKSTRRGVVNSPGTKPVNWSDVEPVLPFMSPVVAAMVTVQFWSGMRPGEVCSMKLGELDLRDEKIWFYEPACHKNSHRIENEIQDSKHVLIKGIGGRSQDALRDYLDLCDNPGDFVFRPIYAMEHRAKCMEEAGRREDRKCKVYPSELLARERRKQTRLAVWQERCRPCYQANSYGKALRFAFDKAERSGVQLEVWSPGQLRHGIAQTLRDDGLMQEASALLGHQSVQMTETYASLTKKELRRVVEKLEDINSD